MQVCNEESGRSPTLKSISAPINIITQELSEKITNAVLCFFSEVSKIPKVKKIAYRHKGPVVTIWTYIDEPKKETLFKIYSIEQQMIEYFHDITLDFTVIFNSKEAAPTNFHEIAVS